MNILRPRTSLIGSTAAVLAGVCALPARAELDDPPFRGQPCAEFSGWECFTHADTLANDPDDPETTSDDAALVQEIVGAIITTDCNIYNPVAASEFTLSDSVAGDLHTIVLQVRALGVALDPSGTVLTYTPTGGPLTQLPPDSTTQIAPGEWRFDWDLAGETGEVRAYSIGFRASSAHLSLDRVELDTAIDGACDDNYCSHNPTSTGAASTIAVAGSAVVADDDFTLLADNVPAGQAGIFFFAPNEIEIPFGHGFLCVAGGLRRLPVGFASPGGLLERRVDFSQPWAAELVAGRTWNFQAWFRDPAAGGPAFNTSDAIRVSFE